MLCTSQLVRYLYRVNIYLYVSKYLLSMILLSNNHVLVNTYGQIKDYNPFLLLSSMIILLWYVCTCWIFSSLAIVCVYYTQASELSLCWSIMHHTYYVVLFIKLRNHCMWITYQYNTYMWCDMTCYFLNSLFSQS